MIRSATRSPLAFLLLPLVVLAFVLPAAGAAAQGVPRAIYTEIPGHPTAEAPGLGIDFTGFLSLYGSPDGTQWIFKAFIDDVENDVIVVGSGTTGAVVAREADPAPIAGRFYDFLDSDCGVNDSGRYAFGARLDAPTGDDEVIIAFDGAQQVAAAREGDSAPGLTDPSGAGNELFGNSLNSAHVLVDGTVGFKADLIQNVDSNFESALYQGTAVAAQEGTAVSSGGVYDSFIGLSGDTFTSSADGSHWIVEADIDPAALTTKEAVVVDDVTRIADGDVPVGAGLPVDAVFAVAMTGNGDWFARGDLTDDSDWAMRNGTVVAYSGDPIVSGSTELWGDALAALAGNTVGDWVLAGNTDNADPDLDTVVVLNGTTVLLREGDGVDLDGDGAADDGAEISGFSPNDLVLGADLTLLAFVTLRDSTSGTALGDAFVVLGGSAIFADGFESGDTSAWSVTVP
jgi:hypothetical protein